MNSTTLDKLLLASLLIAFSGLMLLFLHWNVSEMHIGWVRDTCGILLGALIALVNLDLFKTKNGNGGNVNASTNNDSSSTAANSGSVLPLK
jgi:hypothetical protein